VIVITDSLWIEIQRDYRCNPHSISLALTYSNVFKSNMDQLNL
jgi:hypothetical protein